MPGLVRLLLNPCRVDCCRQFPLLYSSGTSTVDLGRVPLFSHALPNVAYIARRKSSFRAEPADGVCGDGVRGIGRHAPLQQRRPLLRRHLPQVAAARQPRTGAIALRYKHSLRSISEDNPVLKYTCVDGGGNSCLSETGCPGLTVT